MTASATMTFDFYFILEKSKPDPDEALDLVSKTSVYWYHNNCRGSYQ